MDEDRYLTQLKQIVLDTIDKEKYAVFLFGGRARGRKGRAVDVDIGLLGEQPVSVELLGKLYSLVDESVIPYKVDFVDFSRVNEQFKETALSEIEIWNNPPTIKIS